MKSHFVVCKGTYYLLSFNLEFFPFAPMQETRALAIQFSLGNIFSYVAFYFVSYWSSFSSLVPILMLIGKYCTSTKHFRSSLHMIPETKRFAKSQKIEGVQHKIHIYQEYHSVCPLVRIGSVQPLSRKRVCLSPRNQREGGTCTRLRVRGWGAQIGRLEKKPSTLSTLWCKLPLLLLLVVPASTSPRLTQCNHLKKIHTVMVKIFIITVRKNF